MNEYISDILNYLEINKSKLTEIAEKTIDKAKEKHWKETCKIHDQFNKRDKRK